MFFPVKINKYENFKLKKKKVFLKFENLKKLKKKNLFKFFFF